MEICFQEPQQGMKNIKEILSVMRTYMAKIWKCPPPPASPRGAIVWLVGIITLYCMLFCNEFLSNTLKNGNLKKE